METILHPKILCVGGSLNQTTILHQIVSCLPEAQCWFTPFFAGGLYFHFNKAGLLEHTIMGGAHRKATLEYIHDHSLLLDEGGHNGPYDLVIICTDLIVPPRLRNSRIILVQEGMTEPEGFAYNLVKTLGFPRVMANTAATGLSDAYEYFCVASPGYRSLFIRKGVNPRKIKVTGIPNFDKAAVFLVNNFPHKHFVLAATSSIRETFGMDNRKDFLEKVKKIARKKQVIFKLHPNEDFERAEREIRAYFPTELIYRDGNLHEMIANCDIFVAQRTSAIFTASALGKPVYSSIPNKTIRELMPLQNGGTSAKRIAKVCRILFNTPPHVERKPVRTSGRAMLFDWMNGSTIPPG